MIFVKTIDRISNKWFDYNIQHLIPTIPFYMVVKKNQSFYDIVEYFDML